MFGSERDEYPRGDIREDERSREEQREEEEPHDDRINIEVFGKAAGDPADDLVGARTM